ncbi:ABC-three component system protein [Pseudoalteromonas lipolytica]|uniref:ABC-three component system protein n=1 Tax=Pseudoalteromonas lipolytica TaxID=570156 RepID=UPI000825BD0D|nr:ABC-three component system protein [Pseudoalteromonas lipolytica]
MAEDVKSALHDATPSWNGFNYQGKVGLYVCLKLILENLQRDGLDSESFNNFLGSYSVEYEWVEDFSIKNNGEYVSLHQVKHKAGSGFGDHISAVVTILNRKLCRLSETDFLKYIDLDVDYTGCTTREQKNQRKLECIHEKLEAMRTSGYINDCNQLTENWNNITSEVEGVDQEQLHRLLTEFHLFCDQTFSNSKVFFHTAESISEPTQDINEYAGVPEHLKDQTRGLLSLSGMGIYLGFDSPPDYSLVLSDSSLLVEINNLITNILSFTLSGEAFSIDEIDNYRAALCGIIDEHIAQRHSAIRSSTYEGEGYLEERNSLSFLNLLAPLKVLTKQQNDDYWERLCANCFEDAYLQEVERLEYFIERNIEENINTSRKLNLEKNRKRVLEQHKYSELLEKLNPHHMPMSPVAEYYSNITCKRSIKEAFLHFIRELENEIVDLMIKVDEMQVFHTSAIVIEGDEPYERDYELHKIKSLIEQNNQLLSLSKSTHLIIKTSDEHDLSEQFVQMQTIAESIDAESTQEHELSTSNPISIRFESVRGALGRINQ